MAQSRMPQAQSRMPQPQSRMHLARSRMPEPQSRMPQPQSRMGLAPTRIPLPGKSMLQEGRNRLQPISTIYKKPKPWSTSQTCAPPTQTRAPPAPIKYKTKESPRRFHPHFTKKSLHINRKEIGPGRFPPYHQKNPSINHNSSKMSQYNKTTNRWGTGA